MLQLRDIAGLNIEISARCNAQCPFCSRNKKVRDYQNHLLTFRDIKKLPVELFDSLKWVSFGGNFGDPSTNPELTDISKYFKTMCPSVVLMGDTNGSVQDSDWWGHLGRFFDNGFICFAVDGLKNTHTLHRRGTNYNKILENIESFAKAGGVAHWKFILFEHNEHQVEDAEKKAEEIGCTRFFVVSSREYNDTCRKPNNTSFELKNDIFATYRQKAIAKNEQAVCKPYQNHSIYLAADGTVHPCCLAHCNFITEAEPTFKYIIPLIKNNIEQINFLTKPLEEIVQSNYFQEVTETSRTNSYCMMKCNKYRKEAISKLILYDKYFK